MRFWYAYPVPDALYQPFPMLGRSRGQIWRYAPEYRRPRHFHAEPELNLVVAGNGTFGTGNTVIPVSAGDLLFWPPGQDHELLQASTDFDLYVSGLTPELSESVLTREELGALSAFGRMRLSSTALRRLVRLCRVPSYGSETSVADAHVAELWRASQAARINTPAGDALSRRVLIALIEHPELGRAEVARLAKGNPSEVSRRFHAHTGVTLGRYRTRLRLLTFIRAAKAGESTLLSAALNAGFGSYSQCHRAFSRAFGCTPRSFFGGGGLVNMQNAFAPWA
jgi:AraC-like DNA-binding protein